VVLDFHWQKNLRREVTIWQFAQPREAVYAATKAFGLSFAQSLRHELRDTGISVLCNQDPRTQTSSIAPAWTIKRLARKEKMKASPRMWRVSYRSTAVGPGSRLRRIDKNEDGRHVGERHSGQREGRDAREDGKT
jgi:NAD(P)-dependent dehydrogenase (short-subunit alcohol dehydrogenase family)